MTKFIALGILVILALSLVGCTDDAVESAAPSQVDTQSMVGPQGPPGPPGPQGPPGMDATQNLPGQMCGHGGFVSGFDRDGSIICAGAPSEDCSARGPGVNLRGCDLSFQNLVAANLRDAILTDADLSNTEMDKAMLAGADLSGANLESARLIGADLSDANLTGANLRKAVLSGAHLLRANLTMADLHSADLQHAELYHTNARFADFSSAKLDKSTTINLAIGGAIWSNTTCPPSTCHGRKQRPTGWHLRQQPEVNGGKKGSNHRGRAVAPPFAQPRRKTKDPLETISKRGPTSS